MKKKIALVTGGAGFIGSHMVDLLLKKGFKVRVVDNFIGGHKINISHNLKNPNFFLKNIDIRKLKKDNNIFKNVDYVFHFAGIGDIVPSITKPDFYIETNLQGTVNVLEASRFHKIKKFVYAASASCYGKTLKSTSEKNKINIEHPYALSKYLGELAAFHWNKVFKLKVNSIRIFNAYGPRVRTTGSYGAVIGVFFKQKLSNYPLTIVGDGRQTRDFVHVNDVARAFLAVAKSKISGECFNVGTGKPQSVNKLANILGGKKTFIPDRPGEPRNSSANINKIRKRIGWKPHISFERGIRDMLSRISDWKKSPLWTPEKIKIATSLWFNYLKK